MNLGNVIGQLREFMRRESYSESRLSREVGIPQSTLHRALRNPSRLTKTHVRLCKFAGIAWSPGNSGSTQHDDLVQAVMEVWDGTPEHAQTLVRLLKVGATLEAYGARRASRIASPHDHRR